LRRRFFLNLSTHLVSSLPFLLILK
jgi:hypothetical protein